VPVCPFCGKEFATQKELTSHIMREHPFQSVEKKEKEQVKGKKKTEKKEPFRIAGSG